MIGLSGVGLPGTILLPPWGTLMRVVVVAIPAPLSAALCLDKRELCAMSRHSSRHPPGAGPTGRAAGSVDLRLSSGLLSRHAAVRAMNIPKGENPIATAIAEALRDGFDKHYRLFRECSGAAKARFESGDWLGQQRA